MRKQKLIKGLVMLCIALPSLKGKAQVGVNTEEPKATLHIVGKNSNEDTKSFEVSKGVDNKTREILFTVLDDGRIGLGIENPQADLHIQSDGISPAIELERDYGSSGVLNGRSKSMLPINYSNEYNVDRSYGYIGDGSISRKMQVVAYEGNSVLRSESKYGNFDYTEIVNRKEGTNFEMNIRNNHRTYMTEIKNGAWKIGSLGSNEVVEEGNSLSIEGAMVLGDGGYHPEQIPTPAPSEGTMIFYQGSNEEGAFYVWSRGRWRQLDNN